MNIMVVGGGGREHAIIKKLKESPQAGRIYALPGNGGIAADAECVPIGAMELDRITEFALGNDIDFAVVAPDDPLAAGLVDMLHEKGIRCFGPEKAAARIESSKSFAKELMKKYGIPTADYRVFDDYEQASGYIKTLARFPAVIKADGLALGKGVVIAQTLEEADAALYFSDYRSSERTFQLVTQVAGRAGRADKKGRVILQTYAPRHYVFAFARTYDYEGFWRKEINTRLVTKFPPFTRVVRVLAAAPEEQSVVESIRNVYRGFKELEREGGFVYLGASKSPVTRMNGLVRYQVLARILPERYPKVMPRIYALASTNIPNKGSCFAETDPQSFV